MAILRAAAGSFPGASGIWWGWQTQPPTMTAIKKGSTYDAVVILDDTGGKYVNFKLEFPKRKDGVHGKK